MTHAELLVLFEGLPDATLLVDQGGLVVAANAEAELLFGCSKLELIGKPVEQLMPPRFRAAHHGTRRAFFHGAGVRPMGAPLDLRVVRKNGEEVAVDIALKTLSFPSPDAPLTLCSLRDVTMRREERDQLKASESQLHAVLDSALDAIIMLGADGLVSKFNPAAEEMFGLPASAVVGRALVDQIIPAALREPHRQGFARYLATRDATILGRRVESRGLRADGTEFPIELSILRVGAQEPPVFTGFIRDLTERDRLQAEITQAQKMETMGQLAAGIAHDFNNLLAVINGAADLAAKAASRGEPLQDELKLIQESGARGAALTAQLLGFSRKQMRQPVLLDLNQTLARLEGLLRRVISTRIKLTFTLAPHLAPLSLDPGQIEQVVLNLVVNSRDAMPEGGSLTIATAEVLTVHGADRLAPGQYVLLSVSDTGTGMDEATVAKIFDPFFTTKEAGKGTGLGLSTVQGIVKQSGAEVRVTSAPGQGTTFRIYFPLTRRP